MPDTRSAALKKKKKSRKIFDAACEGVRIRTSEVTQKKINVI